MLSLDLRGHGESGGAEADFGTADLVTDAMELIDAAAVDTVVPVALSHAGWLALELRRRLGPGRVPAVVLLDWMMLGPPPGFLDALEALQRPEAWEAVRGQLFGMWTHGVEVPAVHDYVASMAGYGQEAWARAGREMGVDRVELLGYRDPGMDGVPTAKALVSASLEEVAAAIGEVIDRFRPHVVVTLSADDGHRDHVHIRDATLAAVEIASWDAQRLYLQCLPRSLLLRWADQQRARQPDSPYLDVDATGRGTPEEHLTTIIDTSEHLAARRSAIACHRSQTSPHQALPHDLADAFLAHDHLIRIRPSWTGGDLESDIFPGHPDAG